MNMDYSKAFELLNQDAEKERNKKAEKAVHDNLYNKGFRDGLAVLNKIRAEIKTMFPHTAQDEYWDGYDSCRNDVLHILDKYKTGFEPQESEGKE